MGAKICGRAMTQDPIINKESIKDIKKNQSMTSQSEMKLTAEHYGRKKTGNVATDYKLLNPPLGKGLNILLF